MVYFEYLYLTHELRQCLRKWVNVNEMGNSDNFTDWLLKLDHAYWTRKLEHASKKLNFMDCEDLVGECRAELLKSANDGKLPNINKPEGYFWTVLWNRTLNKLGRYPRDKIEFSDKGLLEQIPDEDNLSDDVEEVELRRKIVRDCIEKLTEHKRTCIKKHYWHGRSPKDIALTLNLKSSTTVRTRLHEARKLLKTCIDRNFKQNDIKL